MLCSGPRAPYERGIADSNSIRRLCRDQLPDNRARITEMLYVRVVSRVYRTTRNRRRNMEVYLDVLEAREDEIL